MQCEKRGDMREKKKRAEKAGVFAGAQWKSSSWGRTSQLRAKVSPPQNKMVAQEKG